MKKVVLFLLAVLLFFSFTSHKNKQQRKNLGIKKLKLYWFIPDGVRAEPDVFTIYKWAREGKLPNIKKLMDMGTYGYSKPVFPSHTPVNFATLFTGSYPKVHGVDDGPMREVGRPLDKVAVGGFRSTARKVEAIWETLEKQGQKVALLSIPGSTPPEVNKGVVVRGRWGGWGADFFALNFETKANLVQRVKQGLAARLFFFGPQLTQYIDSSSPSGWKNPPKSFSPPLEVTMKGWGTPVYAYVYDSTNDGKKNFDKVAFSKDKKEIFSKLKEGEWGEWSPIVLKWKVKDKTIDVDSDVRATVIKLDDNGFFRLRLFYNNLNKYITFPSNVAEKLQKKTGPMMDFVDNFPFQLGYYPEDKKTFLQEAWMTFDWHTKAVSAMVDQFNPDVVIQDIYTPNQMLTSRWFMGYIDPNSIHYKTATKKQKAKAEKTILGMYKKLDNILGEIFKKAGKNTYIVFSSDHGNVALNKYVNLNNLFAKKGWLKFKVNEKTGEPVVDWKNSKVIYLKMAHIYINPKGLDGNYQRASGPEYERLRNKVQKTLIDLTDEETGIKPTVNVVKWEDVKQFLEMDPDRVGDLVIANIPGYGWNEKMTKDLAVFTKARESGYKQAIDPNTSGMWTPFLIAGPGIKKNNFLGNKPIDHIQQYPTVMKVLKMRMPSFVQGKPLNIFE